MSDYLASKSMMVAQNQTQPLETAFNLDRHFAQSSVRDVLHLKLISIKLYHKGTSTTNPP
jgi:hypothetical protein